MNHSHIKPVPYYSTYTSSSERILAAALRAEILPKLKRRLPWHHLGGLPHGWIINFIKQHSSTHKHFLRTDISKFYPSIQHIDLVVGVQLAYRDLLGLNYVPKSFKQKYVAPLMQWTRDLPLEVRGIPLSSPLSALTAPLMLVPVWLEIKRRWNVPLAIFMDDILILCQTKDQTAEIYAWLHNRLISDYDLELNAKKTESGRFADGKVTFCGWSFSGGYARIDDAHIEAFKQRFKDTVKRSTHLNSAHLIKRLNQRIDGFGNYYKHGNVKSQYEALDIYIRALVRPCLTATKHCYNKDLARMGLRSLTVIYAKHIEKKNATKKPNPLARPQTTTPPPTHRLQSSHIVTALESLTAQLVQIIALQRKQLRFLERVIAG